MCIESTPILADKQGRIAECFHTVVFVQKRAFIGHLQCMNFLAKQVIVHIMNFTPLVTLAKSLGATLLTSEN